MCVRVLSSVFFVCALRSSTGSITLSKQLSPPVWRIECISDQDITFIFQSENSRSEKQIAECQKVSKSCHLMEQNYGDKYAVYYIYAGIYLIIITDNANTRGQYKCCEMNNNLTCVGTEIGPFAIPTTQISTDRPLHVPNNYDGAAHPTDSGKISDVLNVAVVGIVAVLGAVVVLGSCVAMVALLVKRCPTIGKNGKSLQQSGGSCQNPDMNKTKIDVCSLRTIKPSIHARAGKYDADNTKKMEIATHGAASKRHGCKRDKPYSVRNSRSFREIGTSIEDSANECELLIEQGSQTEVHNTEPGDAKTRHDDFSDTTTAKSLAAASGNDSSENECGSMETRHDDFSDTTTAKSLAAAAGNDSSENECGSMEVTDGNRSPTDDLDQENGFWYSTESVATEI